MKTQILRLARKPFFGRFERPWRWPRGADPSAFEPVAVGSLRALLRRCPHPRGVVVLAHPMGAAAKGFFIKEGHVDAFIEAGFHCITFDFNGFGESPATSFDFPGDLLAVARYARATFPGLPLAVVGASFGAMRAIEAAAVPGCPYAVIVAESVASSLPEFWRRYPLPHVVLTAMRHLRPDLERRMRPTAMIAEFPPGRSVLLIHSRADELTPPSHGDAIAEAAPPHVHVERLLLDRSAHTFALRDERARYLPAVLEFLDRRMAAS